nr:immunoglobulin light chain junction region [Macaca mulatta]MOW30944.1 immunoglobulin light chain junction region [Macaca mulatta]MOW31006.1 immunoglobulin light chain junction region [Macaca mulatta]MOW31007.1 immunoglobulin light chain junction region [Macaca mulatta]MOW31025.1 immunoglobulin light chain junction region [Macaca mulatta]
EYYCQSHDISLNVLF